MFNACYFQFVIITVNGVYIFLLLVIAKDMERGKQEDAHEFLRFLLDAMQKNILDHYPK